MKEDGIFGAPLKGRSLHLLDRLREGEGSCDFFHYLRSREGPPAATLCFFPSLSTLLVQSDGGQGRLTGRGFWLPGFCRGGCAQSRRWPHLTSVQRPAWEY